MQKKYGNQTPDRIPYHLTEKELAKHIKVSVRTLQSQRARDDGIPFVKIGRSVRYDLDAVLDYLSRNTHTSTSD